MKSRHPFDRYVNRARGGRLGLWRLACGVVLTLGIATIAQAFAAWLFLPNPLTRGAAVEAGRTWTASLFQIGAIGTMWIGVWLAAAGLQRRPLVSILGGDRRVSMGHFAHGLLAITAGGLVSEVAFYAIDPSLHRSDVALWDWLLWAAPFAIVLLVQSSAEELLFRGYLLQTLAARFEKPAIWGGIPTAVFALLHWEPWTSSAMNAAILVSVISLGAVAALATSMTGDLGAAIGIHFGRNLFGYLYVSHQHLLYTPALFQGRALDLPGWPVSHAISAASINIASLGGALLLLVHPYSPLRLWPTTEGPPTDR
jgi:membrane protease YdiL (CAAX protease family)